MQGVHLRKYGAEATIDFSVYGITGVDLKTDWVPAASDCEVMTDGGTSTQCTNTAIDEGATYSIVLTATEMQAARLVLKVVDTATKVILDTTIIIETYGHASAQHAFDLDTASVAQTADNDTKLSTLITGVDLNADAITASVYDESTAFPLTAVNGSTLTEAGGTGDHLTAINLPNQTMDITGTISTVTDVTNQVSADVTAVSGDTTAADNLELQYDGTGLTGDTYPSTQAQVGNIASGTAATNTVAATFTPATGDAPVETLTYAATVALDGTTHDLAPNGVSGNTDGYYVFNVGGNGVPVSIQWQGYANSNGDSYIFEAYNWVGTSWDQVGTKSGLSGSTIVTEQLDLTNSHVGTGANLGLVHLRIYSTDGTKFATDRILCSYATVNQSVGYANGNIWVDTVDGVDSNVSYVNGTADNPVGSWANALVLAAALGLSRFSIVNGSSITLTANSDNYTLVGFGWSLALASQSIEGAYIEGAIVTGIGTATVTNPKFKECRFGAVTLPPCGCQTCGFGVASGAMLSGSAGQFALIDCFSLVPGSGSPSLTFSGNGASTGINTRGWRGGATYVLDSDCTLSHEVIAGGGTTITTGGGDVEIRGTTRNLGITMSAAETVQFVGITGLIALSGTTTATVNIYGVASTVTDTTSAATVNNHSVNDVDIADIQTQIGTAGDGLTSLADVTLADSAHGGSSASLVLSDYSDFTGATASNPNVLLSAEINTITSQTVFTLDTGSDVDDAYNDQAIVLYENANSDFPSVRVITDYVGATKQVTVDAAPDFTVLTTDSVRIFVTAPGSSAPTAGVVAAAVWDKAISEHTTSTTFGGKNQKVVPSETLGDYKANVTNLDAAITTRAPASEYDTEMARITADVATEAKQDIIDANVDLVLADTSELQTNQGDWATATGFSVPSEYDAAIAALPTAAEISLALLKYDFDGITGEAARSALNALRFLRNKWSIDGTTLTVTKEDDSTSAWTATVAGDATADPIISSSPA